MGVFRGFSGAAMIAALLVTSATPAMARPGHGWDRPGYGNGYRYGQRPRWGYGRGGGYYRRGDGIDFGDVVLGAIIAGGLYAAVTAAQKDKAGDKVYSGDPRPQKLDADRKAEDQAADLCADAAEREAAKAGRDESVEQISDVARDGDGWRVEGRLEDRSRYQDGRPFVCGVRFGKVDFVQLGDRAS